MNDLSLTKDLIPADLDSRKKDLSAKYRGFGLKKKDVSKFVKTIDELRENPHGIILTLCVRDFEFSQDMHKRTIKLEKKHHYIMSLGMYEQLCQTKAFIKNKVKKVWNLKPGTTKFCNLYKPYTGQDLTDKTLLVWRTGGLGDLCFIQPNLRYIKNKYPSCKIMFACGPQYQPFVKSWEFIDELIDLPFSKKYFDIADYHAIFEGVIERTHEAHNTNAYLLFSKWLNLDVPVKDLHPVCKVDEDKLQDCINILQKNNIQKQDFILLQIRASSIIRTPRPDVWRRIINVLTSMGLNVVITDAPRMKKPIDSLIALCDDKDKVFNFSNFSTSFDYTIALASIAKLVVAIDSALIHIAAGLGTPVIGIFGPFPGEIRMSTYSNVEWINCELHCTPCFLHGVKSCPNNINGHSKCYENINIGELLYKIEKLLGPKKGNTSEN